MAVHTTLSPNTGWTSGFQVWGNGCAHNPLTQPWVNLRVSAGVGKWLCTQPSHPTLDEPQGFSRRGKTGFQQVLGNGCTCNLLTQHRIKPYVFLFVFFSWRAQTKKPTVRETECQKPPYLPPVPCPAGRAQSGCQDAGLRTCGSWWSRCDQRVWHQSLQIHTDNSHQCV